MKDNRTEYRFKITGGYSPETLPSKRLAEYLLEVAKLLGETEHVHFDRVRSGSAVLVHRIDSPAVPKVRERVRSAALPDAPEHVRRQRARLDEMLAADNATGLLSEVGDRSVVLRFPGRDRRDAAPAPVSQNGSLQGELLRVGGSDATAHALIRDGEAVHSCELTREMAQALGTLLYQQVRIHGRGRWRRTPEGHWNLEWFKGHHFERLDPSPLLDAVERARAHGLLLLEKGETLDEFKRLRSDA